SSGMITGSIGAVSAGVSMVRPRLDQQADDEGQVTILFSDIVGYTAMTDRLGDQRTHDVLRTHNDVLRAALARHRGIEVKSEGDGFMLAFRAPHDALAFAREFREQLATIVWPADVGEVCVRMGVHCGQVIRDSDDFFGRTVIIGARIAASAGAREVLVTDEVRAAVGDAFRFGESRELTLKGLRLPHRASMLEG
ncbi:MAG TPA: adenylate/guanylate cyclase domain-containing protein, partial [Acidimicrobiales bacterium]